MIRDMGTALRIFLATLVVWAAVAFAVPARAPAQGEAGTASEPVILPIYETPGSEQLIEKPGALIVAPAAPRVPPPPRVNIFDGRISVPR